jgi:hypothetical protein
MLDRGWKGARMPNDPPGSYDLKFTCPFARWRELAPNHLTYGIEGMEPCAVVFGDTGEKPFAWSYHVKCAVHCRIFNSRKGTRAACLQEASFLLQESINCPGHPAASAHLTAP